MTTTQWTVRRVDRDRYDIQYHGRTVGHLGVLPSGYEDWTFAAAGPVPSRSTQRRLLRDARESELVVTYQLAYVPGEVALHPDCVRRYDRASLGPVQWGLHDGYCDVCDAEDRR